MMVVGLSLGLLGLVYVFAVLIYLKIRRKQLAKRKHRNDHESKLQLDEESHGNTPRSESSKRLELYHSTSMGRRKLSHEPWTQQLSSIVETYNRTWTDRMGNGCEFRAQDFQLEPELFEPELMASPPQEVLEYLERLQNSVTFARHRLRTCYRYQPTLNGIPEDDYFYQELKNAQNNDVRTTPDGGSSSSVASLLEISDSPDEKKSKDLSKVPPKKPKRKNLGVKSSTVEDTNTMSEQERKDIQNAMNTLNDTLEALEYDIYKQDLLQQNANTDLISASCPNSTEGETEDFDSSSCSSLSAVTVLGRIVNQQVDINSTGSRSMERNQCEDFSTFSNSIFTAPCNSMSGLFNHQSISDKTKDFNPEVKVSLPEETNSQLKSNNALTTNESRVTTPSSTKSFENFEEPNTSTQPKKCHEDPKQSISPKNEEVNERHDRNKGHLLKKSSSTESMTTVATDMTSDSLESRTSSPNCRRRRRRSTPNQTPSLVDMWIGKLIQNSTPYSKTKRKPKKMVLTGDDVHSWEHVCQKQQETCPKHDLNDSVPNLIDKLAHYSSKTMAGRDVAGYFQSLKQDILKDHLKSWLSSNNQSNKYKRGISVNYHNKESCPKKPLVLNTLEVNSASKNDFDSNWTTFCTVNGNSVSHECENTDNSDLKSISSTSELIDSLDSKPVESKHCNGGKIMELT